MTFAEFERLPNDPRGWRQELRDGVVFALPPPKHGHHLVCRNLRRLLADAADDGGQAEAAFGYQPVPNGEYWVAGVAYVSRRRWDAIPKDAYLQGSPELVIEVLSPTNERAEIARKKALCLGHGAVEFWVVNKGLREVAVTRAGGEAAVYRSGELIPLFFAGNGSIAVDDIFR